MGCLIWGPLHALRFSMDLAGLWDLTPALRTKRPDFTYQTMCRLVRQQSWAELQALFDAPYACAAPTKLPVGAFELAGLPEQAYSARLSLQDATAELQSGAHRLRVWLAATTPLLVVELETTLPVRFVPKPPPYAGASEGPADPLCRPLSALGYPPPDRPRWATGLYAKNIRREILRAAQPQHSPERTKAPAYHGTDGFLRAGRTHGLRSASDAVCCLACTAAPRASGVVVRILGAERHHASGRRAGAALVPRHVFFGRGFAPRACADAASGRLDCGSKRSAAMEGRLSQRSEHTVYLCCLPDLQPSAAGRGVSGAFVDAASGGEALRRRILSDGRHVLSGRHGAGRKPAWRLADVFAVPDQFHLAVPAFLRALSDHRRSGIFTRARVAAVSGM